MEPIDNEERQHGVVERLAYALWEERGHPFGSPEIDWFRAQQDVRKRELNDREAPLVAAARKLGGALGEVAAVFTGLVSES